MKKNPIIKTLFLLPMLWLLVSCERIFMDGDGTSMDPYVNFDYLSDQIRDKYAFLDYKDIAWEQVHRDWRAKVYPEISQDSLFFVMQGLLNTLRDGHVNLVTPFATSFYQFRQLGPKNYDERIVSDVYLSANAITTGPLRHDWIAGRQIGYIRYASFASRISEGHLDFILNRYQDAKGLIIDIRENGGGQTSNGWRILRRFIDEPLTIYQVHTKNGPGPNDFSPLESVVLAPSVATSFKRKVVILTDRGSYSASSIFSLAAQEVPQLVVIGDTTGGGTGLPNGGQLPNGWTYRFSISQILRAGDQANFEDGVPPTKVVITDLSNRTIDAVIEAAIVEIL
jgi:hypothetical protein